jgi:hypothetical protein
MTAGGGSGAGIAVEPALHTNSQARTWHGVHLPTGELLTSYRHIAESVAWREACSTGHRRIEPTIKQIRGSCSRLRKYGLIGHGSGQAPGQGGLWLKVLHWEEYQANKPRGRAGSGAEDGAGYGQGLGIKQEEKKKEDTHLFDSFWLEYPKKEGKGKAREAFAKALATVSVEALMDGLRKQLPVMAEKDQQYVCMPATWLNQERWADEVSNNGGKPKAEKELALWPTLSSQ